MTPGDISMTFFTNGGAEANENAIKLARWYTGRQKVDRALPQLPRRDRGRDRAHRRPAPLARRAGHPRRRAHVRPVHVPLPGRPPGSVPGVHGRGRISRRSSSTRAAHTVAAVILETVTGTNGIIVPPDGYLQSIREVCDRYGILLIADKVMAGFGRTGTWFAVDNWGVVPDILTMAKGINSGYVPLGAMGDPRADRGLGARQVLRRRAHVQRAPARVRGRRRVDRGVPRGGHRRARRGDGGRCSSEKLHGLAAKHPSIGEVRGIGCFWGLELVKNRETREALVPYNGGRRGCAARDAGWRRRRSSAAST